MTEQGSSALKIRGRKAADKIVDVVSDGTLPIGQLLHTYDFSDAIGYERANVGDVVYGLAALKKSLIVGNSFGKGSWIYPIKPNEAEVASRRQSYIEEMAIGAVARGHVAEGLVSQLPFTDGNNTAFLRSDATYRSALLDAGGFGTAAESIRLSAVPIIFHSRQNQEYLPFRVPSLSQTDKDDIIDSHKGVLNHILEGDVDGALDIHRQQTQRTIVVFDRRFAGTSRTDRETARRTEQTLQLSEFPIIKGVVTRDFYLPLISSADNHP